MKKPFIKKAGKNINNSSKGKTSKFNKGRHPNNNDQAN
jgi:hypothetical protein